MKTERVLFGDVRQCGQREYYVLWKERGCKGEARTMVAVGLRGVDGLVRPAEIRTLKTVRGWALVAHERLARVGNELDKTWEVKDSLD